MFEVDVKGLVELEGGKPPQRLAYEPVANVFDEYRGYGEGERKRPSYCAVTLTHSAKPRGVVLTVADDGPGFSNERDVWTLFGSTAKRSAAGVSGRFNLGDKQLIAVARIATVRTNKLTVTFDGERKVTRHRESIVNGTIVECIMPWSLKDMDEVRENLRLVIPPDGLAYSIDGEQVATPKARCEVSVTVPTVKLMDGVLKPTTGKTRVRVFESSRPTLHELGIPVCELDDVGFPYSLDVGQKIPLPTSRDTVSPAYLYRLIGTVIEAASMDGVRLLSEEQQGAGFIKAALEWVREPEALASTVKALYGENAVRQSSDPIANAQAAAAGCTLVSGRWFGADTRDRMEKSRVLPTSREQFGGSDLLKSAAQGGGEERCPRCGRPM